MELAFRTNQEAICVLRPYVSSSNVDAIKKQKSKYKKIIRPLLIPDNGIINGNALKNNYFPLETHNNNVYDFFISHSHNDVESAYLLAAWLQCHCGKTCFVDSIAWGSADELLKEIDDKYCYRKHSKTYDYKKRNFTTSHVHAILSMSLLDVIKNSKYCIFLESNESISLTNGLKKKTFSPWLYEEIKYMRLLQPSKKRRCFSDSLNEDFKIEYEVDELNLFPFLDGSRLLNLNKDFSQTTL